MDKNEAIALLLSTVLQSVVKEVIVWSANKTPEDIVKRNEYERGRTQLLLNRMDAGPPDENQP